MDFFYQGKQLQNNNLHILMLEVNSYTEDLVNKTKQNKTKTLR